MFPLVALLSLFFCQLHHYCFSELLDEWRRWCLAACKTFLKGTWSEKHVYITLNSLLSYWEEDTTAVIGNPISWFSLWNLIMSIKLGFFHIFHWGGTQLSYQPRVNPAHSRDYPLFNTILTFDNWPSNGDSLQREFIVFSFGGRL